MVAVLASGTLLLGEGVYTATIPQQITLRCTSLALLTFGGLVLVGSRRNRSLGLGTMHAGSWYLLWFGMSFGFSSLAWQTPQSDSSAHIAQESVLLSLLFLHAALVAWVLGYLVGPTRLVACLGQRIGGGVVRDGEGRVRGAGPPWILFGISLLGRLAQLAGGRFGYVGDPSQLLTNPTSTGQIVNIMVQCGNFALIVAAIAFVQRRTTATRTTLIVLTTAQVLVGGLAGGKQYFILTVLAPAMILAVHGRFPRKSVLVAIAVFAVGFAPFIQAYRENSRNADRTLTPASAFAQAPAVLENTLAQDTSSRFGDTLDLMSRRTRQIDSYAAVVQTTPAQFSYLPLSNYLYAPVLGLVPRAIWPSKPVISSGADFARTHFGASTGVYTSAAIPPTVDLHRHGGLLVMLTGMFLIGVAVRLLDRALHPGRDLRLAVFYFPLFVQFVKGEADITSLIAGLPATLLAAFLVYRFAFVRTDAAASGGNASGPGCVTVPARAPGRPNLESRHDRRAAGLLTQNIPRQRQPALEADTSTPLHDS